MSGIIFGDILEIFHILCPGFKVRATVVQSQPLNCEVEIKDEGILKKFREEVEEIYEVKGFH